MTETQLTEGTWHTPAEWRKTKGIKQKSRKKKKKEPGPGGSSKQTVTEDHGKSYGKHFLSDSLTASSSSSPGAKSSTRKAKRGRREEDRTRSAKTVPVPPTGPATSASGTPAATEEKVRHRSFLQSCWPLCWRGSRKSNCQRRKCWSSEGRLVMRSSKLRIQRCPGSVEANTRDATWFSSARMTTPGPGFPW